jgi:hypothetical protein
MYRHRPRGKISRLRRAPMSAKASVKAAVKAPKIHTDERDRQITLAFHCFWIMMTAVIAIVALMLHFSPMLSIVCPPLAQILQEVTDFTERL